MNFAMKKCVKTYTSKLFLDTYMYVQSFNLFNAHYNSKTNMRVNRP